MTLWKGCMGSLVLLTFLFFPDMGRGTEIHVPSEYASIQEAIDNTEEGDTILVGPGTYYEQLYLGQHAVTIESTEGPEATVLDAQGLGPVVTFTNGNTSTLRGFTVTHGNGFSSPYINGGGIISWAEPLVEYCIITENEGNQGGGVTVIGGGTFRRCRIENNLANSQGGGVFAFPYNGAYCVFINTVIAANESRLGAGVFGSTDLLNCTVINNTGGDGITNADSNTVITNTIVYGNEGYQITSSNATVSYCNVEGGYPGERNIDEDPLFETGENDSHHLSSDSPCIDQGTPLSQVDVDLDGDARPLGQGFDIGADEFVPNMPPLALIEGPDTAEAKTAVDFDACSSSDTDGHIVLYEWDWDNDGFFEESNTACWATHTWEEASNVTVNLRVVDDAGNASVDTIHLEIISTSVSASRCSMLGDNRHRWFPDFDAFDFVGKKGEEIVLLLTADKSINPAGNRATLLLTDMIRGFRFGRKNSAALPNTISAILPRNGKYRIWVIEQPAWQPKRSHKKQTKNFCGRYCLTMESSEGASTTLKPTKWVE